MDAPPLLSSQLVSMVSPIAVSVVLVCVLVQTLGLEPRGSPPFQAYLPRPEVWNDEGRTMQSASINAAAIVALAAACSYSFAALYIFRWQKSMHVAVVFAMGAPVAELARYAFGRIPFAIAWNVGAGVGWAIVYRNEHGSPLFANAALVTACSVLAWPFLCLDELTMWASFVGIAIFDIFAVVASFGAFRLILIEQQERLWHSRDCVDLPPGLLYETESGFSLGSGDFLLYGTLVGRASMRGIAPAAAAALGMFLGLSVTVAWSISRKGDSVPALPPAVFLGVLLYLSVTFIVAPALANTQRLQQHRHYPTSRNSRCPMRVYY